MRAMGRDRLGAPRRDPLGEASETAAAQAGSPPAWHAMLNHPLFGAAGILFVTIVAYLPAIHGGFIWDDNLMVPQNTLLAEPGGLARIWLKSDLPDYWPVTYTSLWLDWRLWQDDPRGYHVVNILIHALNAILLWRILRCLGVPGAWLAGLIFAIHPVNAASAAWISERKNTLSMLFVLLAFLAWLRYEADARTRWYVASLTLFIVALLAKTSVVMFPVALLLYSWWKHGRITFRYILRTTPFFAASFVLGLVTLWLQDTATSEVAGSYPVSSSALVARVGWIIWFCLGKVLMPVHLSAVYPRWADDVSVLAFVPGALLVAAAIILGWKRDSWARPIVFGLGFFGLNLIPVLGIVRMSFNRHSFAADHWQYVPIIGVVGLAVAMIANAPRRGTPLVRVTTAIAGLAIVCCFITLTYARAHLYTTEYRYWHAAIRENPAAPMCHDSIGNVFMLRGQLPTAMQHFNESVRLDPAGESAHNFLGVVRSRVGDMQGAINEFREAIHASPRWTLPRRNLAQVLEALGNLDEAAAEYREVIRLRPAAADAHNNLGLILSKQGRNEEAARELQEAARLAPKEPGVHTNLAAVLMGLGDAQGALREYRKAFELTPTAETAENLRQAEKRLAGRAD
jgi:protein O-mannosyl-transferase